MPCPHQRQHKSPLNVSDFGHDGDYQSEKMNNFRFSRRFSAQDAVSIPRRRDAGGCDAFLYVTSVDLGGSVVLLGVATRTSAVMALERLVELNF